MSESNHYLWPHLFLLYHPQRESHWGMIFPNPGHRIISSHNFPVKNEYGENERSISALALPWVTSFIRHLPWLSQNLFTISVLVSPLISDWRVEILIRNISCLTACLSPKHVPSHTIHLLSISATIIPHLSRLILSLLSI